MIQSNATGGKSPQASAVPASGEMKRTLRWLLRLRRHLFVGRLWYYSTKAYQAKLYPLAVAIKMLNFVLYHSILCYQCEIEADVYLGHFGLDCVVHPNVKIGRRVKIMHHVSIAAETIPGSESRVVIEDDVVIGMYAIIIGNDQGGIRIGKGAIIGAGAIVSRDVPPGAVVVPMPSRPVKAVSDRWG